MGPLAEYKEHMQKCVDGAAAFIKARLAPVPVTFVCPPITTEQSNEISKPRSMSDPSPGKVVEAQIEVPDKQTKPKKQTAKPGSGKEKEKPSSKQAKEADLGRKDAREGASKAPAKVVLCRHFERLGTCRLGAKCLGFRLCLTTHNNNTNNNTNH